MHLFDFYPLHIVPHLDIWPDLVKLLQESKTWDFIGNVGYAAVIGIGGFVIRKFSLKIRKNATAIGEITTDVLEMAKQNEALKAEVATKAARIVQLETDLQQEQDNKRLLTQLFDMSKDQWSEKQKHYLEQIDTLLKTPRQLPAAPKGDPSYDPTEYNE